MTLLRLRPTLLALPHRLYGWLMPVHPMLGEGERRAQHRAQVAAWIGATGLGLALTLVEMALDMVTDGTERTLLRPVVFVVATLIACLAVMSASFRQSADYYGEHSELDRAIEHQARFDGLTDLPNRTQFHDRLQRSLDGSRGDDAAGFALLVIDLDGFKEINDTRGHAVGDLLLQEIAKRLQAVLRPQDMVARTGGDEFVALLVAQQGASAEQVAVRLLQSVAQPMPLDGRSVQVSASIGIVYCPMHGSNADQLLRRGDLAMYVAKRDRNTYIVYTPGLEPSDYALAA